MTNSIYEQTKDFYDRLEAATQRGLTNEELAQFEAEYALLQARITSIPQSGAHPNTFEDN